MSECYIQDAAGPCICDNCDWQGDASELEMIRDIEQRLTPGGIVPAGQCPDCGALAYLDKPDYDPVAEAVKPLGQAIRAILVQVVQGKVLERDSCIAEARKAIEPYDYFKPAEVQG